MKKMTRSKSVRTLLLLSVLTVLTVLTVFAFAANATIWTVNNNADSPGQFTDLQVAIDSVSAGDSIYISGSETSYGNLTITKELHLFGAGYNPNKQIPDPSTTGYIYLDTIPGVSGASNTTVQGFNINGSINNNYSTTKYLYNVIIRRNRISERTYVKQTVNMLIANNIIYYSGVSHQNGYPARDLIIANNIFVGGGGYGNAPLNEFIFTTSSVLITNNIFMSNSNNDLRLIYNGLKKVIFTNNIFYHIQIRTWPSTSYITYSLWNSNISLASSDTTFPATGTNNASNNHENVDPMFVSETDFIFDYTDDYHLQAGSPGIAAGTDGTDIGIYGGPFPFPDGGISGGGYQTSQETPIPQIYEMNVLNSALPVNGDLHIDVKAHSQN